MSYLTTKRLFALVVLLATVTLASAQKGKFGIGLDACLLGVIDTPDMNPGVSIKAQYNISDVFKIEPTASYFFSSIPHKQDDYDSREAPCVSCGLNLHTSFLKINHQRHHFYLITGISYSQLLHEESHSYYYQGSTIDSGNLKIGNNTFGVNVGLGTLFRISRQMNLNIDITYDSVIKGCFKAGIVYNFN